MRNINNDGDITIDEDKVTISLRNYNEYLLKSNAFDDLVTLMLADSKISYSDDHLTFKDEKISTFLEAVIPDKYRERFNKLMEEKGNGERREDNP